MALKLQRLEELEATAEHILEYICKSRQETLNWAQTSDHQVSYLPILSLPDDEAIVWASWDKMTLWSYGSNNNTEKYVYKLNKLCYLVTIKVPFNAMASIMHNAKTHPDMFRQQCALEWMNLTRLNRADLNPIQHHLQENKHIHVRAERALWKS